MSAETDYCIGGTAQALAADAALRARLLGVTHGDAAPGDLVAQPV